MLESTYRPFLNAIAYKTLMKPVSIPDGHLCIGEAENLGNIPVLIFKDIKPQQKKPEKEKIQRIPYEQVASNFSGDVLSIEDFNNGGFDVGEPTVRW